VFACLESAIPFLQYKTRTPSLIQSILSLYLCKSARLSEPIVAAPSAGVESAKPCAVREDDAYRRRSTIRQRAMLVEALTGILPMRQTETALIRQSKTSRDDACIKF